MLKRVFVASVTTAVSIGVAMANTVPYIGASTGITTNTANVKIDGSNFTGGAYRGVPLNVFVGYGGLMMPCVYLAGELFGNITTANISDDTQMKSSYGYGASFIPGLLLNDRTMAYARAGIVSTRFSRGGGTPQTGGQFGLGLQTNLTQNVDLRGEYDFVAYQAKSYTLGVTSSSVAPRTDQFTVGLVYKLD